MGEMAVRLRAGEERHAARAVMAVGAVARAQSEFDLEEGLSLARPPPDLSHNLAVVGVYSRYPAAAGQLRGGNAGDLRPPCPAPVADPVRVRRPDQLRRGLDQRAVTRLAIAERLLGLVPDVNVNAEADPLLDAAVLVAQRNRATHVPAVLAVGAQVTMARFVRRAREDGLIPFGPEARRVVRMDRRQPSGAEALFERQSRQSLGAGWLAAVHPDDAP